MVAESTLTQCGNVGLMLGYQQNRIRAFYNIGGDPVVDCLLPFLCATCVNARNDREIRVREGDMELRRKFIYTEKSQAVMDTAAVLPVRSAPPIIEPMRYVSPRQTSEHTSNHSFAAPPYTEDGQALHGDLNIEPQRPRFAFLKPQEHRREDGTDPQRESRARASVEEAEHAATRNQEPSFEGQHCGRSDNDIEQPVEHPAISPTINVETETQKINLLLEPQDSVARRVGFDTDTTDIPGRRSSEHSLTESEGRDTATSLRGKRSNIGSSGGGQLSYVHDFSDCPVNKSVLMYYEKEENKFKNPTLQDYTSSQLGSNNPYQRLLIHCHPNPDSSGNDTAADEYVRLPHRAVSSSRPTRTASSHYEGLEQSQDGSSKPPATRSAEDLGPTRLAYDPDSRADKKATSF